MTLTPDAERTVATGVADIAAAGQALGRRLAALRVAAGLTQHQLAAEVCYGRSTIANVEIGRQRAPRAFWVRIDAHLHTNGSLTMAYDQLDASIQSQKRMTAGAYPTHLTDARSSGAVDNPELCGDTGDMLRRTILGALLTAVEMSLPGSRPDRQDARRITGLRPSSTADDWREVEWEYGHAYASAPRAQLLADLTADVALIADQRARVTETRVGSELDAIAARLTGLTAMTATGLGYSREARHLWRSARRLAAASTDRDTLLWVSGHEVTVSIYQGRPLLVVLELADRTVASCGTVPVAGTAELLGGKAQTLALLGRAAEARATLAEANRILDLLPAAVTTVSGSIYSWPEHRLRHAESFVHTSLGDFRAAQRARDRALALYPKTNTLSRGQLALHHARCLVRQGHIADGLHHAQTTVMELTGDQRNNRYFRTLVDQILIDVPNGERSRSEVRAYHEVLMSEPVAMTAR